MYYELICYTGLDDKIHYVVFHLTGPANDSRTVRTSELLNTVIKRTAIDYITKLILTAGQ